jgi:hypothetical protein
LNPQLIKIHRPYSVAEVARLFGIDRITVRRWITAGLPVVDQARPILIRGRDLKEFLEERRSRSKRRCPPGEMYCFKCRLPRRPARGIAYLSFESDWCGRLVGLCSVCGIRMSRLVSMHKLEQAQGNLTITATPEHSRMSESKCLGLSDHFGATGEVNA